MQDIAEYVIMNNYEITDATFNGNQEGVRIKIYFGRRLSSIFFSTYLPTILMNIINQATNYFERGDLFGDVIGRFRNFMIL